MVDTLALALKVGQDRRKKENFKEFIETFSTHIQPAIDKALDESQLFHFARFSVVDETILQFLVVHDAPKNDCIEFLRLNLPGLFKTIFALGDETPPWDEVNTQEAFLFAVTQLEAKSLGMPVTGPAEGGWMYSAFGAMTVWEIRQAISAGWGWSIPPADRKSVV